MASPGYVRLWRQITEHPLWQDSQAAHLFLHFLISARRKPGSVPIDVGRGQTVISLRRGQTIGSRHYLSETLNIKPSTIRNLIERLEAKYQVITTKQDSNVTVVTIVNYSKYQQDEPDERTANRTLIGQPLDRNRTTVGQPLDTPKNEEHVEHEENEEQRGATASDRYLLQPEADVAFEQLPLRVRRKKQSFRVAFAECVKSGVDPNRISEVLAVYYASPEGSGSHYREAHNFIAGGGLDESPEAWSSRTSQENLDGNNSTNLGRVAASPGKYAGRG